MKKTDWWLGVALLTVIVFAPLTAFAHFLGYDAVDGGEIRYTDHTTYDDARGWAISKWNAQGPVDILKDKWNTVNDLKWKDATRSDVSWAGRYSYRGGPGQEDYITFNKHYVNAYGTSRRRNVALHELGHGLGLDHSFSGQVMYAYVTSLTTLQSHDKQDYNALW